MSRLLPKSLFGQTLLILLAGLIVSHAVGSWIYTADREQAVRAVGGFAAAQRIANLTRLVQEAPREWRERIVAALSDQTLPRLALGPSLRQSASADDDTPVAQAIKEFLVDQLSLGPARQPRVSASPAGWPRVRRLASDDGARPDDAWLRRLAFGGFRRSCKSRSLCRMASGSRLRPLCPRAARRSRASSCCPWESWRSSFSPYRYGRCGA